MFQYNPQGLTNPQAVNVNTSADSANVVNSLGSVSNVFKEAQAQRNKESEAIARVKAAKVLDNSRVLASKVNQTNNVANLKMALEHSLKLSQNKFGQDSRLAKVANENRIKAAALLAENQKDLLITGSNNQLFNQQLQNEEEAKKAELKSKTDERLALIKSIGKDGKVPDRVFKKLDTVNGTGGLAKQMIDDLDNKDWFVSGLDETSQRDLKAKTVEYLGTKEGQLLFQSDPNQFMNEVRKEFGETDFEFNPIGGLNPFSDTKLFERKWTPNTKKGK